MSRLLFAAARGARIQATLAGQWSTSPLYEALRPSYNENRRIHPEDEHLQYGPISTTLRKNAENPFRSSDGTYSTPYRGQFWIALEDWMQWDVCTNELHRALFLLILAEALADEGL